MSNLFGSTTQPTPSTPIIGNSGQTGFFQSLYGLGLTPNTADGGFKFNSMPAYSGQLTPDLSQMMAQNVWNSWSPQSAGSAPTQQLMQGIQGGIGQMSPYVSQIQGGGAGPGNSFLNQLMQQPNPLTQYGGGGQQVSYPLPKPNQVQAPQGPMGGLAQIIGGKQRGQS